MKEVMVQINTYGQQMNVVKGQLQDTTAKLEETARNLDDAEARIVTSDDLLKSRIRLSYTNGFVSYIDVLFSATSFSDFLGRMDSLHAIMNQNKEILQQQKQDKELIVEKKKEVETSLADIKVMYTKLGDYNKKLAEKEREKQTLIANYDAKLDELDEVNEEQIELVMDLAKKEAGASKQAIGRRDCDEEERSGAKSEARSREECPQ